VPRRHDVTRQHGHVVAQILRNLEGLELGVKVGEDGQLHEPSSLAREMHIDDRARLERLVLDPATPVHVAAGIAHHAAGVNSMVEQQMCVPMHPEHRHIKEGIRKLVDENAGSPIIGVVLRQRTAMGCMVRHNHCWSSKRFQKLVAQPGSLCLMNPQCVGCPACGFPPSIDPKVDPNPVHSVVEASVEAIFTSISQRIS
jgi:hypothetical protein